MPTPISIADYLAGWAIQTPAGLYAEPSFGRGALLGAMLRRIAALAGSSSGTSTIRGMEIQPGAATQARERLGVAPSARLDLRSEGFFSALANLTLGEYDAVVANPPYARFGRMPVEEQLLAKAFMREQGWTVPGSMNTWVPFVIGSACLLKRGGRLAMVLPAELLQVRYAHAVRTYLATQFGAVTVVTFRRLVFPGVQQSAVLLLGVKGEECSFTVSEVTSPELLPASQSAMATVEVHEVADHTKWTQYLLKSEQWNTLRSATWSEGVGRLGNWAGVDVGVVTGENAFFIVTREGATGLDAGSRVRRILTKTRAISGTHFSDEDWSTFERSGVPSRLLYLSATTELPTPLEAYIAEGQDNLIDRQYKCSLREPWYAVPSVWTPDAFLSRQIGLAPRLAANDAEVTCTDTLLRVTMREDVSAHALSQHFVNSLTFLWAEILGRSYGGGVLEVMPSEAEMLPVPAPTFSLPRSGSVQIDSLVRSGEIEAALDLGDEIFLGDQLGIPRRGRAMLRAGWHRLVDLRTDRPEAS